MQRYGIIHPSSRISNTQLALFEEMEEVLSAHLGRPATALFSSGFLAAQAAVSFAAGHSQLLYPPVIHPSLRIAGMPAPLDTGKDWQRSAVQKINNGDADRFTLVLESVQPLGGQVADFGWLKEIKKNVQVLIDDSHGIGILGEKGSGISGLLPQTPCLTYVICYSLAKAYSLQGGAVSGTEAFIRSLKRTAWFSGGTPLSPAFAHAWLQASSLFEQQRAQLMANIRSFRGLLSSQTNISNDERLPVFISRIPGLYEHCYDHRCLLSSFSYPTEKDTPVTRIVLNALHRPEDLEKLAQIIVHCDERTA